MLASTVAAVLPSLLPSAVRSSVCLSEALHSGMYLCDVPTPALLLDHTTAATWRGLSPRALDAAINDADAELLADLLFVHVTTVSGREAAGAVGATTLAQRETPDAPIVLATLDCSQRQAGGDASFLGLGMNNHLCGGYYWGRSTGPGAAMPAPGVALLSTGVDDDDSLRLVRIENSNDGKRSEWCEFLAAGDQMQIVHDLPSVALSSFDVLVGVTRDGHRGVPRGAEPIVEACWVRQGDAWVRIPWSADFEVEPETLPKGPGDFMESWGLPRPK